MYSAIAVTANLHTPASGDLCRFYIFFLIIHKYFNCILRPGATRRNAKLSTIIVKKTSVGVKNRRNKRIEDSRLANVKNNGVIIAALSSTAIGIRKRDRNKILQNT